MSDVSKTIKQLIEQSALTLHTCLVCEVLDVDAAAHTAKIQPLTLVKTIDGAAKEHTALSGVPYTRECGENITIGGVVVAVFAERDVTLALKGEHALPPITRHHSLADGIIIGTIEG